jgi:integrase
MHRRDVAADEIVRRAMGRAGVVTGFQHRCRRHGCGFNEERRTADPSRCPRCGFALWAKPLPRHVRFHDLRHTTATLLLKEGVPLAVVQRIMRHSDPELTAETYGHLDLDDMRRGLDRLTFEDGAPTPTAPGPAPVLRVLPGGKNKAADSTGKSGEISGLDESGRQDLNLRPLGPEPSALPG